jgi:hypothetical protein
VVGACVDLDRSAEQPIDRGVLRYDGTCGASTANRDQRRAWALHVVGRAVFYFLGWRVSGGLMRFNVVLMVDWLVG